MAGMEREFRSVMAAALLFGPVEEIAKKRMNKMPLKALKRFRSRLFERPLTTTVRGQAWYTTGLQITVDHSATVVPLSPL